MGGENIAFSASPSCRMSASRFDQRPAKRMSIAKSEQLRAPSVTNSLGLGRTQRSGRNSCSFDEAEPAAAVPDHAPAAMRRGGVPDRAIRVEARVRAGGAGEVFGSAAEQPDEAAAWPSALDGPAARAARGQAGLRRQRHTSNWGNCSARSADLSRFVGPTIFPFRSAYADRTQGVKSGIPCSARTAGARLLRPRKRPRIGPFRPLRPVPTVGESSRDTVIPPAAADPD